MARPRARARAVGAGDEGLDRRGDPRRRPRLDRTDPATIDISPGAYGHNSLGANDGKGWAKNPVTGQPYAPQVVPLCRLRARHGRVLGRRPEVGDAARALERHRQHRRRLARLRAQALRQGSRARSALLGRARLPGPQRRRARRGDRGVGHQAAHHDGAPHLAHPLDGGQGAVVRPSAAPPTIPMGLPLVPGLIEVITKESSAPGQRHAALSAFVGQIAVRDWLGEPGDRAHAGLGGVGWVRAVDWITYQRRTFVTPAFPGVHLRSQHLQPRGRRGAREPHRQPVLPRRLRRVRRAEGRRSSRSRRGRRAEVRLQWASYYDASDEAGQSRIWGGIHICARRLGRSEARPPCRRRRRRASVTVLRWQREVASDQLARLAHVEESQRRSPACGRPSNHLRIRAGGSLTGSSVSLRRLRPWQLKATSRSRRCRTRTSAPTPSWGASDDMTAEASEMAPACKSERRGDGGRAPR